MENDHPLAALGIEQTPILMSMVDGVEMSLRMHDYHASMRKIYDWVFLHDMWEEVEKENAQIRILAAGKRESWLAEQQLEMRQLAALYEKTTSMLSQDRANLCIWQDRQKWPERLTLLTVLQYTCEYLQEERVGGNLPVDVVQTTQGQTLLLHLGCEEYLPLLAALIADIVQRLQDTDHNLHATYSVRAIYARQLINVFPELSRELGTWSRASHIIADYETKLDPEKALERYLASHLIPELLLASESNERV